MSNSRVRDRQIKVYVTERERDMLKRKSRKAGLTVSEYVRQTLIHSDGSKITLIDIEPLERALFEMHKQGVNLNELMKYLNTYKEDAREAGAVDRLREELSAAYMNIMGAIIALREEASKHKVIIDFERHAMLDEED